MGTARRAAAVLLFFAALTVVLAYPLSVAPGSRAIPLSADTRLFLWTVSWDLHALAHAPLRIFDANIFFPERHTLAYSEHLIGSAVLASPFYAATGNPLLAINAIVLLSCVLSGAGGYFLARQLRLDVLPALLCGVVFAFGAPRFARLAQVHLAAVQWIPFGLGCVHAYARGAGRRALLGAAAFFTLQSLASGHGGLFLLLATVALVAWLSALERFPPLRQAARDLGVAGLGILAVNALFLLPYLAVRRDVGLHRTLGSVADWAPNAVSFIAAPTHVQAFLLRLVPRLRDAAADARAYLFPGWITLGLACAALVRRGDAAPASGPREPSVAVPGRIAVLDGAIALAVLATLAIHVAGGVDWTIAGVHVRAAGAGRAAVAGLVLLVARLLVAGRAPFAFGRSLRRARTAARAWAERRDGVDVAFYVVLAALSLWASLGPGFGLYLALYRLVPGFDLIRVPSRLTILTLLAMGVLAAAALERILRGTDGFRRVALGGGVIALVAVESAAFPLKAPPYDVDVPAIDRRLAELPEPGAVLELPAADSADATQFARFNSYYMLHSTAHWRPLVNGYSGLVPPRHEALFRLLPRFPDEPSLAAVESLGVRFVVVHPSMYPAGERAGLAARFAAWPGRLTLVGEDGGDRLYAVGGRTP